MQSSLRFARYACVCLSRPFTWLFDRLKRALGLADLHIAAARVRPPAGANATQDEPRGCRVRRDRSNRRAIRQDAAGHENCSAGVTRSHETVPQRARVFLCFACLRAQMCVCVSEHKRARECAPHADASYSLYSACSIRRYPAACTTTSSSSNPSNSLQSPCPPANSPPWYRPLALASLPCCAALTSLIQIQNDEPDSAAGVGVAGAVKGERPAPSLGVLHCVVRDARGRSSAVQERGGCSARGVWAVQGELVEYERQHPVVPRAGAVRDG